MPRAGCRYARRHMRDPGARRFDLRYSRSLLPLFTLPGPRLERPRDFLDHPALRSA